MNVFTLLYMRNKSQEHNNCHKERHKHGVRYWEFSLYTLPSKLLQLSVVPAFATIFYGN